MANPTFYHYAELTVISVHALAIFSKPKVLQIIGNICQNYLVVAKTTPRSCHGLWLTLSANISHALYLTLLSEEQGHLGRRSFMFVSDWLFAASCLYTDRLYIKDVENIAARD